MRLSPHLILFAMLTFFLAERNCLAGQSHCVDSQSQFTEVRSIEKLPQAVAELLGSNRQGEEGIADRGGRFNSTDVVDNRLPMRRFDLAGVAEKCVVVAVELGGRGHSVEALFFQYYDATWHLWTRRNLPKSPASLNDLLEHAYDEIILGGLQ